MLILGNVLLQSLAQPLTEVAARILEGMTVVVFREKVVFHLRLDIEKGVFKSVDVKQ